jgi:hypothetical protein
MPDSTLNRRSVALLQAESNRLSYPQKTAESQLSGVSLCTVALKLTVNPDDVLLDHLTYTLEASKRVRCGQSAIAGHRTFCLLPSVHK